MRCVSLIFVLCALLDGAPIVPDSERIIINDAVERNIKDVAKRKDFVKLLIAVRRTENGRPGYEFGVEHDDAIGIVKQAGWCAAICWKRWLEYDAGEYHGVGMQDGDGFVWYLASRYCPVNREVWFSNVVFFILKQEGTDE